MKEALINLSSAIIKSQFWSSYGTFFGSCCYEMKKFRANLCFYSSEHSMQINVSNWDNMDRVITDTRPSFQTFGRAFSFLLNPQKVGRVFQKLG